MYHVTFARDNVARARAHKYSFLPDSCQIAPQSNVTTYQRHQLLHVIKSLAVQQGTLQFPCLKMVVSRR